MSRAVPRQQPPGERAGQPFRFERRLVALLCFTVFFSVLNGTMFNVAVPDIARDYRLSPSAVSWVLTGYIVVFALGAVTFGKLADRFAVRDLISVGLLLFNAGALIGLFAQNYPMLLAGRLLQASGGSAIPALAMLVATRFVPEERRGRVLGAVASTVAFAAGTGPMVGGFIAGEWHWRFLFLLSNATLIAIPGYRRLLPAEERRGGDFDLPGALLLAAGVALLLVAVTEALWIAFPLALAALAGLALHIHRTETPFVPPQLFGDARFRTGLVTAFLGVGTMFGMMFLVPLMLRQHNALQTDAIGMVIFPGAMSAALLGFVGGRLADRFGSLPVVKIGLLVLATGHLLLSSRCGAPAAEITLVLVVCYGGFSFIHASLAKTVTLILPPEQMGVGMGVYNLIFFTSGAFGSALGGRLLETLRSLPALNPLAETGAAAFSNIFLLASGTVLTALLLFRHVFTTEVPGADPS